MAMMMFVLKAALQFQSGVDVGKKRGLRKTKALNVGLNYFCFKPKFNLLNQGLLSASCVSVVLLSGSRAERTRNVRC